MHKVPPINSHLQKYLLWIIGVFCVVVTCLPLVQPGFFRPHDFTHAARIVEMNRSLQRGEFPVRWSENFGFGYGMPLFNFYAPLPYYIAQIPFVLSGDAITAIKCLYVLNAVLAFVGMYMFAKQFWKHVEADSSSEFCALVSAVVFTFATYRALDLYVRGAVGEVTAMVLLPFALYGVLRLKDNLFSGFIWISGALAAILLSHNLTGMLSVPLLLIFGTGVLPTLRKYIELGIAIVLAGLMSAFYIVPAFAEKGFTRVEQTITTGYFDYHNHFVALRQFLIGTWGYGGSVPGLLDGISFALGMLPIGLCILTLIVIGVRIVKQRTLPRSWRALVSVVLLLGMTLFMATEKSVWIWDHVQTLKFLQFPWRFLSFVHVFLALIAGGSVKFVPKKAQLLTLLFGIVAIALLQGRYFSPEKYDASLTQYYATDAPYIREEMSKTLNDYLPPSIQDDHLPNPTTTRINVIDGKGTMISDAPSRSRFETDCSANCMVQINVFQFPGWSASLDGSSVPLVNRTDFPTYVLSVPSGRHEISVQLEDTAVRRFGNWMSILGIAAYIAFLYRRYGKRINQSR